MHMPFDRNSIACLLPLPEVPGCPRWALIRQKHLCSVRMSHCAEIRKAFQRAERAKPALPYWISLLRSAMPIMRAHTTKGWSRREGQGGWIHQSSLLWLFKSLLKKKGDEEMEWQKKISEGDTSNVNYRLNTS